MKLGKNDSIEAIVPGSQFNVDEVNEYYEQVLRALVILDKSLIQAKRLDGQIWYEIDDEQDLNIASSLFAWNEE